MSNRVKTVIILVLSLVAIILFTGIVSAATYNLYGRVTDKIGNPLANSVISVIDPENSTVLISVSVQSNGDYDLIIEEGIYDVQVVPPVESGFAEANLQGLVISGDTNTDFVLVPVEIIEKYTLTGRLIDSSGDPVGISDIDLTPSGASGSFAYTSTDSSGFFSVEVTSGSYDIQFSPRERRQRTCQIIIPWILWTLSMSRKTSTLETLSSQP